MLQRICLGFISVILFSAVVLADSYQINAFTIEATTNGIVISKNDKQIWSSCTSSPFISASVATVENDPVSNGEYDLSETILSYTTQQVVNSISFNEDDSTLEMLITVSKLCEKKKILKIQTCSDDSDLAQYSFTLSQSDYSQENALEFKITNIWSTDTQDFNRLSICFETSADEGLYGFGEQYSAWNMKGKTIPILVSEQGIGRGLEPTTWILNTFFDLTGGNWHTTYAPKPLFITSTQRGFMLDNSQISIFDLSNDDSINVEVWNSSLVVGRIFSAASPLELISSITNVTGRMISPPEWTQQGAIVGLEGGTEYVENITYKLVDNGVPLVGVWLQDWVGLHSFNGQDRLQWNWELDTSYYPNWDEMASNFSEIGIHLLTYINPFFSDVCSLNETEFSQKGNSGCVRNLFQEGNEKGYFVKNSSGETYMLQSGSISFATLDLTNPDAARWMKDIIIDNMIEDAESFGWMSDFAEYIPFDAVFNDNSINPASYHNVYPQDWARINREAIEEAGKIDEVFFFSRSGWLQSPMYSINFWAGDQLVTWDSYDGIKTVLISMMTSGIGGHSMIHSDIGGYTILDYPIVRATRSKELLMRWIEMATFSGSVYRSHVGSSLDPVNYQVWTDDDTISHFATFGKMFASLSPYRKELMNEAEELGYPLGRHPYFHFFNNNDKIILDLTEQFMLGDALMVAPVLESNTQEVSVYLPACEEWLHVWTQISYNVTTTDCSLGNWITISAPLGKPGLFIRMSSEWATSLNEIFQEFI